MIKKAILAFIFTLPSLTNLAQTTDAKGSTLDAPSDNLIILDSNSIQLSTINFAEPTIEEYVQLMDSIDSKTSIQKGYRIQLHSISGPEAKESIFKIQSDFISKHEGFASYANWSSPNWVLRIGNYRSRLEASQALETLKIDYPAAFILADQIETPYKK